LAHGAGRKWSRSESRLRMRERFGARQLVLTGMGNRSSRSRVFNPTLAGASPVGHPNFDGPKFAGYRSKTKGWLLTVREPPGENPVMRVRVPLAKPRICGATCPSDHPVVQLR